MKMANVRSSGGFPLLCAAFQFLMVVQTRVSCYQYKVGDLDAWGIPTSANPHVYPNWSKKQVFKIGDSLCKLFLFFFFTWFSISLFHQTYIYNNDVYNVDHQMIGGSWIHNQ